MVNNFVYGGRVSFYVRLQLFSISHLKYQSDTSAKRCLKLKAKISGVIARHN